MVDRGVKPKDRVDNRVELKGWLEKTGNTRVAPGILTDRRRKLEWAAHERLWAADAPLRIEALIGKQDVAASGEMAGAQAMGARREGQPRVWEAASSESV